VIMVPVTTLSGPVGEIQDGAVGAGHQAVEGREPIRSCEVEHDTPLVPVDGEEDGALRAKVSPVPGAGCVAATRLLDLHDVGAHVGQVHAAGGPGDQMGQLEHSISSQGQGRHHGVLVS
jgi:hypothetical protein